MKLAPLIESEPNLKAIALEIQQKLLDREDEMPGLEFGPVIPIHADGKLVSVKLTIMPASWTGKKSATKRERLHKYSCKPQAIEVYNGPQIELISAYWAIGQRKRGIARFGPGLYYIAPDDHSKKSVLYEAALLSAEEGLSDVKPVVAFTVDLELDQIDPFVEEFVNGWDTGVPPRRGK